MIYEVQISEAWRRRYLIYFVDWSGLMTITRIRSRLEEIRSHVAGAQAPSILVMVGCCRIARLGAIF